MYHLKRSRLEKEMFLKGLVERSKSGAKCNHFREVPAQISPALRAEDRFDDLIFFTRRVCELLESRESGVRSLPTYFTLPS
ncbi:hypothetical protein TNIN_400081 [Trichonephila inaurata madagascariensis]|uniref:Uncharacterized protein n=1 Tax=Trichonephila inaurata madagascariensis TaxID=2747483 RepID=A0A8X7CK35_9ARAC|nr:hypothetical protein TNIN_400081 [Trichonephila inaurata madagascariensis]